MCTKIDISGWVPFRFVPSWVVPRADVSLLHQLRSIEAGVIIGEKMFSSEQAEQ